MVYTEEVQTKQALCLPTMKRVATIENTNAGEANRRFSLLSKVSCFSLPPTVLETHLHVLRGIYASVPVGTPTVNSFFFSIQHRLYGGLIAMKSEKGQVSILGQHDSQSLSLPEKPDENLQRCHQIGASDQDRHVLFDLCNSHLSSPKL
jgi:hypothetical protein